MGSQLFYVSFSGEKLPSCSRFRPRSGSGCGKIYPKSPSKSSLKIEVTDHLLIGMILPPVDQLIPKKSASPLVFSLVSMESLDPGRSWPEKISTFPASRMIRKSTAALCFRKANQPPFGCVKSLWRAGGNKQLPIDWWLKVTNNLSKGHKPPSQKGHNKIAVCFPLHIGCLFGARNLGSNILKGCVCCRRAFIRHWSTI